MKHNWIPAPKWTGRIDLYRGGEIGDHKANIKRHAVFLFRDLRNQLEFKVVHKAEKKTSILRGNMR